LTQSAHILPSRKLSQPRRSWYSAARPNREPGCMIDFIVLVPREERYLLNRYTISGSICWSLSHCTKDPNNYVNIAVWLLSLHHVMCCVDSSTHLQFGHLFLTFFLVSVAGYCDSIQFISLECETCLVIYTQNTSGKDDITLCIPSQYTRGKSFMCIFSWQ
jgi:hypothetical protein